MDPDAYEEVRDGSRVIDWGSNQSIYIGFDWDNHRVAWGTNSKFSTVAGQEDYQPRPDTPGFSPSPSGGGPAMFGSAHPSAYHSAMCDGSVQTIAYDVDAEVAWISGPIGLTEIQYLSSSAARVAIAFELFVG